MNVLILTPDRVGSTLLQRVLTVYANINENKIPPTINTHELTNGLVSYHNSTFNCDILSKQPGQWGNHQSLPTIVDLLEKRNHDIIGRVAHYHIKGRNDSMADQLPFYQYLNDNFYIIACRRKNLFEHAMSWAISAQSKLLNVFSFDEKYITFKDLQKNGMDVQPEVVEKYLRQYDQYLDWVDRHFNVNTYFEYERDMPNIEQFILNLNVFKGWETRPLTWEDKFDIDWNTWNRMHYLLSLVPFDHPFDEEEKTFIKNNIELYTNCRNFIRDLKLAGVMINEIPIKLHTLKQKADIISNIDQCLLSYNKWVGKVQPSYALPYTPAELTQVAQIEHNSWTKDTGSLLTYNDVSKNQLLLSDLKRTDLD